MQSPCLGELVTVQVLGSSFRNSPLGSPVPGLGICILTSTAGESDAGTLSTTLRDTLMEGDGALMFNDWTVVVEKVSSLPVHWVQTHLQ